MTEISQVNLYGYEHELIRYCRLITGSEWDAEDLYQIVQIKLFQAESRDKKTTITKAFLFRVATNAWIDICRKNKINWDELDESMLEQDPGGSPLILLETVEILLERLTPQQMCILLLVDIFLFTPRETAEMVKSTEGAVKALLFRARKQAQKDSTNKKSYAKELIETFVNAFKQNDPGKIGGH